MDFIIADPIPTAHTADSFEVAVRAFHGDGDVYETITLGPFARGRDEAAMQDLVETLRRMQSAFPQGRRGNGMDDYDPVDGFFAWFDEDNEIVRDAVTARGQEALEAYLSSRAHRDSVAMGEANWPWEDRSGTHADIADFKIIYFDAALAPHAVTIKEA